MKFQCRLFQILFEFKISHGELFEQEKFEKCWKAPYDIDVLQNICILIGSDYFKGGLKGFGRVAARRYYAKMFPSFDLNRVSTSTDIAKNKSLSCNFYASSKK